MRQAFKCRLFWPVLVNLSFEYFTLSVIFLASSAYVAFFRECVFLANRWVEPWLVRFTQPLPGRLPFCPQRLVESDALPASKEQPCVTKEPAPGTGELDLDGKSKRLLNCS